jgi:hypothetical protein
LAHPSVFCVRDTITILFDSNRIEPDWTLAGLLSLTHNHRARAQANVHLTTSPPHRTVFSSSPSQPSSQLPEESR